MRLRGQGALVTLLYVLAVAGMYGYLSATWHNDEARWWLGLASVATLVQTGILWWSLPYNHRPSEATLFPKLGYANALTLTRGLLTCLLAGFLFTSQPTGLLLWVPALLYTVERMIDYIDGFVARITDRETKLGAILDMEFDGLGILIASGIAIQYGKLPIWYLILGLGRQLFLFGMWIRQRQGKVLHDLPLSDHRRLIAGFQTSFISVALWPALSPQITLLAGYFFAVPLILSFGRDWLVVSDALDNASSAYQQARRRAKTLLEGWLPLAVRLGSGFLALSALWQMAQQGNNSFLLLLWTVATLALMAGVLGRVAALFLVSLAVTAINANGLRLDHALFLLGLTIIIHLGCGKLALWMPEDRLLHMKLGEKRSA